MCELFVICTYGIDGPHTVFKRPDLTMRLHLSQWIPTTYNLVAGKISIIATFKNGFLKNVCPNNYFYRFYENL